MQVVMAPTKFWLPSSTSAGPNKICFNEPVAPTLILVPRGRIAGGSNVRDAKDQRAARGAGRPSAASPQSRRRGTGHDLERQSVADGGANDHGHLHVPTVFPEIE